jgi:hypothetical protein
VRTHLSSSGLVGIQGLANAIKAVLHFTVVRGFHRVEVYQLRGSSGQRQVSRAVILPWSKFAEKCPRLLSVLQASSPRKSLVIINTDSLRSDRVMCIEPGFERERFIFDHGVRRELSGNHIRTPSQGLFNVMIFIVRSSSLHILRAH